MLSRWVAALEAPDCQELALYCDAFRNRVVFSGCSPVPSSRGPASMAKIPLLLVRKWHSTLTDENLRKQIKDESPAPQTYKKTRVKARFLTSTFF